MFISIIHMNMRSDVIFMIVSYYVMTMIMKCSFSFFITLRNIAFIRISTIVLITIIMMLILVVIFTSIIIMFIMRMNT
uniref:Uncharacterized protein n=1 Tax=Ciona intestinalis TaxID=7719 RepID=H2XMH9_CIOIN